MCTHIRRDLACGHRKFIIHLFCDKYLSCGRVCALFVIHREFWNDKVCMDCEPPVSSFETFSRTRSFTTESEMAAPPRPRSRITRPPSPMPPPHRGHFPQPTV